MTSSIQAIGCDLHFPHKNWSDERERENYLAIERWALHFRKGCISCAQRMMPAGTQSTGCDLHIPYKEWSNDPLERENYLAIERWALHFRKNCLPKGGPAPEPIPTPGYPGENGEANSAYQWPSSTTGRQVIRWNPSTIALSGQATVHSIDPVTSDYLSFSLPPGQFSGADGLGNIFGMSIDGYVQEPPYDTYDEVYVNRTLTIEATNRSTGVLLRSWSHTYTVHRGWGIPADRMHLETFADTFNPTVWWVLTFYVDFGGIIGTSAYMQQIVGSCLGWVHP